MIELYAANTPNGRKATIMLAETGIDYRLHKLELSAGDQHRPEFRRINPNGKIPVFIDADAGLSIAESGAILIYLAEKAGRLLPQETIARFEVLQWLFFQVGSVGPMTGQYDHFRRHQPRQDYAFARYRDEVLRLLEVMNGALDGRGYIAGDYSIADIALIPWLRAMQRWEIVISDFPAVAAWFERIIERPAVRRGFAVLESPFNAGPTRPSAR